MMERACVLLLRPAKRWRTNVPRLQDIYRATVVAALTEKFDYSNVSQVPEITKVSVNVGLGEAVQNAKVIEGAQKTLEAIVGQKSVIARAKTSIAGFKLREGMPIGVFVTLRRDRMWEFLDRLISVALPRVKDFRGVNPRAFDGNGNYNLGIKEQIVFPEVSVDRIDKVKGMNISIATSAVADEEGRELLRLLGMPFRQ